MCRCLFGLHLEGPITKGGGGWWGYKPQIIVSHKTVNIYIC